MTESVFAFLRRRWLMLRNWRERKAKLTIFPGDFDDLNPPGELR